MINDGIIIYHDEPDEKIYVKVNEGTATLFQLQNLAGKVLQEEIHTRSLHDFDLLGLPEGNYFVIVNQNDHIRSKKIIKE